MADVEEELQRITNEEALVIANIRRGSKDWRKIAVRLIMFFVVVEVLTVIRVGFSFHLMGDLKVIALVVLLTLVTPTLFAIAYLAARGLNKIFDQMGNRTLAKLQAKRRVILLSQGTTTGNNDG